MGNNTNMKSKNFSLPKVDLSQTLSQNFKVVCGKSLQEIPIQIDPKFKYNTFNLKTQQPINPDSTIKFDSLKSLKILTYNIWFEQHNVQNRMNAILQIIKQTDADIVCLQQVTQQFMQLLRKNSKQLCAKRDLFLPAVPMHWYDTIILSKYPMNFYQLPFKQSTMNRNLLMGVFQVITAQNQILNCSINCVHLESLNNQKLRLLQLKQIAEVNKQMDIVVVAGDMNFGDSWPEDKVIQSEYIDAWQYFQQKNIERWTMPSNLQFSEWRPDHILIKNNKHENKGITQSKKFQGKIGRVGAFTIAPFQNQQLLNICKDGIVRTPSDHMGLLVNFRF